MAGIRDRDIASATGVPRPTVTRACAGASWDISLSADELNRLKTFAAERLAGMEEAAAALTRASVLESVCACFQNSEDDRAIKKGSLDLGNHVPIHSFAFKYLLKPQRVPASCN